MKAPLVAALIFRSDFDCPAAEPGNSPAIRRLVGTTITTAEAESFARKTLDAAHVTGAQLPYSIVGISPGARLLACAAASPRF